MHQLPFFSEDSIVFLRDERVLVKGYEIEKGHFVVLTKEDFKAAAVEKTQTVDILDFVKAEDIDDRFFEVPYYLTPAKGGDRAYARVRSGRVSSASRRFPAAASQGRWCRCWPLHCPAPPRSGA